METCAVHFHCSKEMGENLLLSAGDDALEVKWLDIDEKEPDFANLYSNHKMIVLNAVSVLRSRVNAQAEHEAAKKLQGAFRKHKQPSFKGKARHSFTVGNDTFRTAVHKLAGKHFTNVKEHTAFMNSA